MQEKLQEIRKRFEDIEAEMSRPEIASSQEKYKKLTKERSLLLPVVENSLELDRFVRERDESRDMLANESDSEMREMLSSEIDKLDQRITRLEEKLLVLLLPRDPSAGRDVIMEIRAGTGGEEAALFAADLFRLYTRYADMKGWPVELLAMNPTGIGGYKEISFSVRNPEAYETLKYESGVHRVQRIPETESGGRIHTSAVTVAVMPEAEESEMQIDPNDLKIDVYRASGHGGQSVNTTDSAVRITHIPTGMVVTCQDEKSQHKNKAKALRVLRSRLADKINAERMEKESAMRRSQVGSGDRSERIRTYNFPQSRVTDHRIGLTLYSLDSIMMGELDDIVGPLKKHEVEQLLQNTNKSAAVT